ncbi:extracellular solute-binding protein [Oerskovia sp. M15]
MPHAARGAVAAPSSAQCGQKESHEVIDHQGSRGGVDPHPRRGRPDGLLVRLDVRRWLDRGRRQGQGGRGLDLGRGFDEAAEAFNASHDDIQIKYTQIESGNKGGYDKIRNSITAGNAPCLAQVGFETLPSFVAEGNVVDVTEHASADKDLYAPAGWAGVNVGGKVYGAPQDQGPMVLFYNKAVLDANGVAVPTTWAEYEAAGVQLKAAGIALTGTYEDYDYTGFAWQAGAPGTRSRTAPGPSRPTPRPTSRSPTTGRASSPPT